MLRCELLALAQLEVQALVVELVEGAPGVRIAERAGSFTGCVGEPPGVDVDAADQAPPGQAGGPLEERRPQVQLDLLGHVQAVVQQPREPITAAGPRLDGEDQAAIELGTELDLAGLQVPLEGGQAERRGRDLDHPHRSVPGPGHAHDVLVAHAHVCNVAVDLGEAGHPVRRHRVEVGADAGDQLLGQGGRLADAGGVPAMEQRTDTPLGRLQPIVVHAGRDRWRCVGGARSAQLTTVQRRRAPQVVPAGECNAERPHRSGGQAPA